MRYAFRAPALAAALLLAVWAGPGGLRAETGAAEEETAPQPDTPGKGEAPQLEEEFQGLIEELKGLEKDAREKFRKEILPRIREEIRRLREKLREFELDDPPPETRNT